MDKLQLRRVGNTLLLSTTLRDSRDNLIVEIHDNVWQVPPERSQCWDKNYTDDSLEVKDGRGRVVLQLRIFPSKVTLQIEWPNLNSHLVESGKYTKQDGIQPRFKYPSGEHWGEIDPSSVYDF